jgi:hypothetical protein
MGGIDRQLKCGGHAPENVTDSSLDSLQIDENRCERLPKKLLLHWLQPVEEL